MAQGKEKRRTRRSKALRGEQNIPELLGSRIAARFRRIGLDRESPELRGQTAHPAAFEQ